MNHRRALRLSTDAGLIIFLLMAVGVVLWITDVVLGWNLLPDWIDRYAELIVIICSLLAAFAVVMSVMCSLVVMAESMAEKNGIAAPKPLGRWWLVLPVGALVVFVGMFGLHKLDEYRADQKAERRQQYLQGEIPANIALFSPQLKEALASPATAPGPEDERAAKLLKAIAASTSHAPEVSILVKAASPMTHCVIKALWNPKRKSTAEGWQYLERKYLTSFPEKWEREAVRAAFAGGEVVLPAGKRGVFFNPTVPQAWGALKRGDEVVGLLMLSGH